MHFFLCIFGASGIHPVGSNPHQNKKTALQNGELFFWRRWWDSNPRARLRTKRFRVVLVTTTSIHLRIYLYAKFGKYRSGRLRMA